MKKKACLGCGQHKPLSEFYTHARMADGHLNKCKDCVKKRIYQHRADNIEEVRAYDRKRGDQPDRLAAHRAYAQTERGKERLAAGNKAWIDRNQEKRQCHITFGNALRDGKIQPQPCEECGAEAEAHHEDYSKPLEVQWLCMEHHKALHKRKRALRRAA